MTSQEGLKLDLVNPDIDDGPAGGVRVKIEAPGVEPGCCGSCCCCCKPKPSPPSKTPILANVTADSKESKNKHMENIKVQKLVVIYNPFSGNGASAKAWETVHSMLKEEGIGCKVLETQHAGHATELALEQDMSEYDCLVGVGGDGTLHEIIQGLMKRPDGPPPFAMIPGGTGNAVNTSLNRLDVTECAQAIIRGNTYPIDVARMECHNVKEGRPEEKMEIFVFNVIGWGLGVDANESAEDCRCCGPMRYDCASVWQICRNPQRSATVTIDGETLTKDYSLIIVQNNQHTGADMRMAPAAQMDDGRMDLLLMEYLPRGELVDLFGELKREGSHVYFDQVDYRQFQTLRLECEPATILNIDGENIGGTPMDLTVLKHALRIFY